MIKKRVNRPCWRRYRILMKSLEEAYSKNNSMDIFMLEDTLRSYPDWWTLTKNSIKEYIDDVRYGYKFPVLKRYKLVKRSD